MDIQKKLIPDKTKEEKILQLFSNLRMYDKIVIHYGNVNSKIMIIAEAPMAEHTYNSDSNSIFCFDLNNHNPVDKNFKSGDVIIKIFNDLHLLVTDFYWTNAYKIPIEDVSNKELFHSILEKEIDIVDPVKIICLGANAYSIATKLNINVNIAIEKLYHPAYILRNNFQNYQEYLNQWKIALHDNR